MLKKLMQRRSLRLILLVGGLALGSAAAYWFRRQLGAVLSPVLAAVAIAYILNPVANWLERRCRHRTIAVLLIFIAFFGLVALIVAGVLPMFADEVAALIVRIPLLIEQGQGLLSQVYQLSERLKLPPAVPRALEQGFRGAEQRLLAGLTKIPEATVNVAKGLFSFVLILVLSFYLLRDFEMVKTSLYWLVPRSKRPRLRTVLQEVDSSLGKYIRGQLLLALIVGTLVYLSLLILGVEFSLLWGIFAGLTETIPYFGPFLGAAPAVFIALLTSWSLAVKTILVFIIIQQVESNFISPYVLGKTLGLHPLAVFLALLVGGQFFGIWGLVLAVPAVAAARIVVRNLALPPLDNNLPKG